MIKEACVENFTNIPAVLAAGARRIELNDNLPVGGTTVSQGVMQAAAEYAHAHSVPVVAMIRPRGGDFCYTAQEQQMMLTDIGVAESADIDAVTFGVLTADHQLDKAAMATLIEAAGGMTVVMHMAFDAIPEADQPAAIDWLAAHGVARILTHGGPLTKPITETLPHLQTLVKAAAGELAILPGGGITAANVDEITTALGVHEAHGSRIVTID